MASMKKREPTDEEKSKIWDAARTGDLNTIDVLVSSNVDVTGVIDRVQSTALHLAAMYGYYNVVAYLLSHGARVNDVDSYGQRTALHLAAINGHYNVVAYLLSHGARVNDVDDDKWTPLHCAAYNGHAEIADLLVKNKASISMKDYDNRTPLQLAVERGKSDAVYFFVKQQKMDVTQFDDKMQRKIDELVKRAEEKQDLSIVTKEVYLKFYKDLVELLPMKDAIFVSLLITLLPGDLKAEVDSKATKAQAAIHFLDNGIKPALESGEINSVEILLSAMETFDSMALKSLAKKMKDEIQRNCSTASRETNQSTVEEILATASSESILSASSQLTTTEVDVSTTAKLKEKPTPKMLSRITGHLAAHWKRIGYELLELKDVESINSIAKTDDEKCLDMLIKWLTTDPSATYSKLIDALNEYDDLSSAVEKIKNKVLK